MSVCGCMQIAVRHKLQHPFILDLLKRLIEGSYPMLEVHVQMELKRHLVEHLVQLLSCGHVLEVSKSSCAIYRSLVISCAIYSIPSFHCRW